MRENVVTAKSIHEKLIKLESEVNDFAMACDSIKEDVGTESLAYKLLSAEYTKKLQEKTRFENQHYTFNAKWEGKTFNELINADVFK